MCESMHPLGLQQATYSDPNVAHGRYLFLFGPPTLQMFPPPMHSDIVAYHAYVHYNEDRPDATRVCACRPCRV